MDQTPQVPSSPSPTPPNQTVTEEQLQQLRTKVIEGSKAYAMSGTKTRRTPSENDIGDKSAYDYWDKEETFEADQWSVYYWKFDDGKWEVQLTRIELKADGHSLMSTYSIRPDEDLTFPGIQVYREERDMGYRKGEVEDIVYLDRVIAGLKNLNPSY